MAGYREGEAKVESFRRAGLDLIRELNLAAHPEGRDLREWPIKLVYSAHENFVSTVGCMQAAVSEMGKPDPVD